MGSFRKMRGCKKPEREQGLIYYTCLDYRNQPKHIQQKIDRLCLVAGRQYAAALKELLTRGDRVTCERVAMDHCCSANTLWAAKRRFFNLW